MRYNSALYFNREEDAEDLAGSDVLVTSPLQGVTTCNMVNASAMIQIKSNKSYNELYTF